MTRVFHSTNRQCGFTLIAALFILLGLAVLGGYLLSMSTVQSMNSVFALQGARGYQAANSGIEWGIARALAGNCAATTTFTLPGSGFDVSVSCQAQSFTEGTDSYNVYRITSLAESGSYGDEDYISRQVETRVVLP